MESDYEAQVHRTALGEAPTSPTILVTLYVGSAGSGATHSSFSRARMRSIQPIGAQENSDQVQSARVGRWRGGFPLYA